MSKFAQCDRLIPQNLNLSLYRHSHMIYNTKKVNVRPNQLPVISLQDDFLFSNLYEQNINSRIQLVSTQEIEPAKEISDALEFDSNNHVFSYRKHEIDNEAKINLFSITEPIINHNNAKQISQMYANTPIDANSIESIKTIVEKTCLKAPNLRDDFYSNLISWSCSTPRISMALGSYGFTWGINSDITRISDRSTPELITCTSFSPQNDWLVIGTSLGKLSVIKNHEVIHSRRIINYSIYCICWFKNGNQFFLGDEIGDIHLFEIKNFQIKLIHRFNSHKQQVCSIAINNDEDEVAIGGNDNCCNIWNITNLTQPKLRFKLKHAAAVKGVAYCPWSKSLLATGGGSRDRNLRFWHSKSGTLLNKYYTNSQITSIIWSKFKKQIAVTFGFGNNNKGLIVYSYPSMIAKSEIPSSYGLRFLSSALSPDGTTIAVTTNEATIRIYQIWEKSLTIVKNPEIIGGGTHGSSIIEQFEGILTKINSFR